jgi:capsular exopolysaccharide synthesis family protein
LIHLSELTYQSKGLEGAAMNNELTIQHLLMILTRRRMIIIWPVVGCLLLALIACILMTRRYQAFGEIEVQKSATDSLGLENLANARQESSDALDDNVTLQTQAKILESNTLALKVINDLNLEKTEDFKPKDNPVASIIELFKPGSEEDPENSALEDAPHRRDHAIRVLQKHLRIKPLPGTRLIQIQYTSSDPKLAAAVVNDIAKSLVDYTLQNRYSATSEVSKWLGEQLGKIKNEADKLQRKVEQLEHESGVFSFGTTDAQGKEMAYSATLDGLQQATQALSMATSARILKGGLYKTVQNGNAELISSLAGSSLADASPTANVSFLLLQNLRTQQAALASQIASDTSKYGPANPKLGDEKASLDSINAAIKAEVDRIGQRTENDYKASQIIENNMRGVYRQQREAADKSNGKAVTLLIARQEAADARALYQTLNTHLKEAGVIEGLHSSNISVVDAGRIPSKPFSPNIPLYLGLSVLTGGFVGILCALLREATDDRVDEIGLIENSLHTQILGVLPATTLSGPKGRRELTGTRRSLSAGNLMVLDGPNTAYVEALRGIRTSLLIPADGPRPSTILITSACEKEGKSTVSLNLAAALTLNGSRVLLVDADLRSAGLSSYMGFERPDSGMRLGERAVRGLSGSLSGFTKPDIFAPFPELETLHVLAAGPVPTYPAELLGSQHMKDLIEQWLEEFDYVIIDSPPVIAVTDALILAQLADIAVLVARHGQTTRTSLERSYRLLHDVKRGRVRVVINAVQRRSVSYNGYYGYQGTTYYRGA